MKLPQRYSKADYEWCLDYKYMGKQCRIGIVTRPWTREEMMAYLDWNAAEEARIEKAVRKDIDINGFGRGPGHYWAQAEKDAEEQSRLYEEL